MIHHTTVSIEELVQEINTVNHAWKVASQIEIADSLTTIAQSLGNLKTRLQVRLLRSYAPEKVYLQLDLDTQGEELYGLILCEPVENYWNAAHLPVRIAQSVLTPQEIKKFTRI
ncbi:hypothetical protein C7H19_24250 [Aphanothece hegewaldii CCALA 016]|uniref:Uncharacterized protein n=1 Tax=Aphanothece hegewaldii CCALA 016 TaxID=2107694 RepID=A0A2T1LQR6_9CHRO|nr:hypothetical protein [Aphanothece hegewaldii]PSF29692.1 hypothetical protein C7H19_24250 [Aphanothece hegewaldii CCALA 016]